MKLTFLGATGTVTGSRRCAADIWSNTILFAGFQAAGTRGASGQLRIGERIPGNLT